MSSQTIDIGSRLELFVDDYLVEQLNGAELRLHRPEPQNVAVRYDAPWEGNTCGYVTVFQDGDIYRMYYRGAATGTARPRRITTRSSTAMRRAGTGWSGTSRRWG